MLQKKQCVNVTYHLLSTGEKDNEEAKSPYVSIIDTFDDGSLDFCLVDGSHREFCALRVLEKILRGSKNIARPLNFFSKMNLGSQTFWGGAF